MAQKASSSPPSDILLPVPHHSCLSLSGAGSHTRVSCVSRIKNTTSLELWSAMHQSRNQMVIDCRVIPHLVNFQLVLSLFDHFVREAEGQLVYSEGR